MARRRLASVTSSFLSTGFPWNLSASGGVLAWALSPPRIEYNVI